MFGQRAVNLTTIPAFSTRSTIHVVIESPRGSTLKLKYAPQLEAVTLSRPLPSGLVYPYDWGFVPSTRAADGDPLDAMVLWDHISFPGMVLSCRLLGMLAVEQNGKASARQRQRNDRVFAVPIESPRYSSLRSVSDLSARTKRELEAFFLASTALEDKDVKFLGWSGSAAAGRLVRASLTKAE
jgi:inorganic pyrophosphatase